MPRTGRGGRGGRTKGPGRTVSREWAAETWAGEPTGRMSVFSRLNLEPIVLEVSVRQEPMAGRGTEAETEKVMSPAVRSKLARGRDRSERHETETRRGKSRRPH